MKFYSVDGYDGVAFYSRGNPTYSYYDPEIGDNVEEIDDNHLVMVMVGDDREHTVPYDCVTEISEDDFCHQCGQIGCGHG